MAMPVRLLVANDTLIGGAGGINYLIGDVGNTTGGTPSGGDDRLVSAANTTDHMWGDFQSSSGGTPTYGHATYAFEDKTEISATRRSTQAAEHSPPQAASHNVGSFADLTINDEVDVDGDGKLDSVIQFDPNNSVTVYGATGLTLNDFDFVI
jgi:hypothetical protein